MKALMRDGDRSDYPGCRSVAEALVGFATVGRSKQSSATSLLGACMTPQATVPVSSTA
jgi:hypothetical protein